MHIQSDEDHHQRAAIIGANLRALRLKHGYTLDSVARRASVSISHLANAEQGRRSLSGEQLRQVLDCYGFSLGVFLTHIESLLRPAEYNVPPDPATEVIEYPPIRLIGKQSHEPQLFLLHPTYSETEPEHLLLILPPATELWRSYLVLPCRSSIGVAVGTVLVETPKREFALPTSGYLTIPAHTPHRFRNHTRSEARAYIWVETARL